MLRGELPHSPKFVGSPLPLTEANLALLDSSASEDAMAPSLKDPNQSHLNIPSERRRILEDHGLYYDKDEVTEAHPEVTRFADKILKAERHDGMAPESVTKFAKTIKALAVAPETTTFLQVWPLIFKEKRDVKNGEHWEEREWAEDGLKMNADVPFKVGTYTALDMKSHPNKAFAKLMPRIQDPKPDRSYGVDRAEFTEDEQDTIRLIEPFASPQPELYFGFAVVEFKGPREGIAEAEDQAARSGSTLVEAGRHLYHTAGHRDVMKPGADLDSVVFSIAMNLQSARLFAHWALVREGKKIQYHMTFLRSYDFKELEKLKALRHDFNCVMDWGLLERKEGIKGLLPAVRKRKVEEEAQSNKKAKTGTETETSTQTSSG